MTILIVRHALAGDRKQWQDDDRARPLSGKGRRQTAALLDLLADHPADRVISSPYMRCVQTVAPLADARGLKVETTEVLTEGVDRAALALLLDGLIGQDVMLCTHGSVVEEMLRLYGSRDVDLGTDLRFQKASTWILEDDGRAVVRGHYLPAPSV